MKIPLFFSIIISSFLLTLFIQPFLFSINKNVAYGQAIVTDDRNQSVSSPSTLKITNPIPDIDNINTLLAAILSAIVQIAIPFLVLAIMYVGFLFVAARGNPQKLAEARQALFYVLLGALIILGSETLSRVLSGTISELTS